VQPSPSASFFHGGRSLDHHPRPSQVEARLRCETVRRHHETPLRADTEVPHPEEEARVPAEETLTTTGMHHAQDTRGLQVHLRDVDDDRTRIHGHLRERPPGDEDRPQEVHLDEDAGLQATAAIPATARADLGRSLLIERGTAQGDDASQQEMMADLRTVTCT